jgi:osmotically inducible protein OsmC
MNGPDDIFISKIHLTTRGSVPGVSEEDFLAAANGAKDNCPLSKALASVPEITLDAKLEG